MAAQALALFVAYRVGVSMFGLTILGVWSIASASATLGRIGDLGFAGAVPRLVAMHRGNGTSNAIPSLIETAVLATAGGTLVLALLAFYPLLLFARSVTTPAEAALVMPFLVGANISLVAGGVAAAFLGCLDGIGEFRMRAFISVVGALVNPVAIYLMGDALGPVSLAVGAILQACLTMVSGWLVLKLRIGGLSSVPVNWSRSAFRELFQIGKFTQANSVLIMLFEPASRMLAGRFGGLEFAAVFDLAAKVAGNLRLLFSSFAQSLIPFHAYLKNQPDDARRLFISSTMLTAIAASGISIVALAAAPVLSIFSLTSLDLRFVGTFWLLLLGNLVNVLGGPGYSYVVGGGAVAAATRALGLQALVFIGGALALRAMELENGVSFAYAIAVTVSGAYLFRVAAAGLAVSSGAVLSALSRTVAPTLAALAMLSLFAFWGRTISDDSFFAVVAVASSLLLIELAAFNLRAARRCLAEIVRFRMTAAPPSN